ncbi:MAG: peroxidase [Deltaproteobacteria bacterium CG2_30_63_29]|nr:MAG: peroxidase [Deltaproteobacteria bacterium CG2_30_63_29]PIW02195.1 MAG: peroxidase [Deltaproteobacteria bacterium CG17_big_fil_post_rev_8_21_14_2_50_63_7]PJB49048.1 MAG: peroxidase [Deltaproteobacteria bacterium CG_4_9_14_3_um_filter_63_12]
MNGSQTGILAEVPSHSRYLFFDLRGDADPSAEIAKLIAEAHGNSVVVGLGRALVGRLGGHIEGLQDFPALSGPMVSTPSTQAALWLWLRGNDPGHLHHVSRWWIERMSASFMISSVVDGFRYQEGRDLTGYVDGTANPTGEQALEVGVVGDQGPMFGSSFVAVQQWVHDLDTFQSLPLEEQDHIIGRRVSDNEEIDDAPATAHVKRTAQEEFAPAAFLVRRSVPWADGARAGLMFVAFGRNFAAFDALIHRMVGLDDGLTDSLFRISRPITGSMFWCPPVRQGRLDLSAITA